MERTLYSVSRVCIRSPSEVLRLSSSSQLIRDPLLEHSFPASCMLSSARHHGFQREKTGFWSGGLLHPSSAEEKLGQAEKTELDPHLENLISRADSTKNWTEKILRQTEVLLQPNPSARIEEFIYDKLDKKLPSRSTNPELLGQYMLEAANEFGPGTPYGSTLITVGEYQKRLGGAERELLQTSAATFLTPLRNFLEGDWRTISKERRLMENRRLDLDICKARLKKAKQAEAKAAHVCAEKTASLKGNKSFSDVLLAALLHAAPDFQETRPRNYVLSASASAVRVHHKLQAFLCCSVTDPAAQRLGELGSGTDPAAAEQSKLLSEEVDKAEHDLRVAQTEFDRQAEVTRLLLEGISSTHLNHLRCLQDFAEAQATYYATCHHYMQDLQRELHNLLKPAQLYLFFGQTDLNLCPLRFTAQQCLVGLIPLLWLSGVLAFSLSRCANAASVPQPPAAVCPDPVSSAFLSGPSSPGATVSSSSSQRPSTLAMEQTQLPVTGTRKAKVLYDYDAHDSSELSLLADELITVYTVPGMDPDWLIGERGNQKGKVPVTYLELLS
ncbi:hypothetical protein F7725_015914 [Dissostichus mawsoni]|uniref:SH3-domain GRB2-like endophilin B2b n=1 Tax=Dissostichus mawsoni TaxID=36200 RepID=A0A7J5YLX4_DISMA|nr:hypothetical protein F7725_015914 [Dissostichus mawsoni]